MPKRRKVNVEQQHNNLANYLQAKTDNQKDYIRSIAENDVVFCTGPSGSGKTYISAGIAAEYLHHKKIEQIVISRPLIAAGKDIGALPGELNEKIDPYLKPMQQNLKHFLGQRYYGLYINDHKILYEPLELMRGATYHHAIMILDEAQNCTLEQIKMFVTRMGEGSKVIINGDISQTDLHKQSGLDTCIDRVYDVTGIGVCELTYADIQRNPLISRFLMAIDND